MPNQGMLNVATTILRHGMARLRKLGFNNSRLAL